MKYIDADLLRKKIEEKYNSNDIVGDSWDLGYDAACKQIIDIIILLQQEQPDEDLEKAMYNKATSECDIIWNEMDYQLCYDNLIEAFVAGAEWAREQMSLPEDTLIFRKGVEEGKRLMMEDAVEADVNTYTDPAGGGSWAEFVVRMPTQNLGDKVKIIILPKGEEKCGTSKLRNREAWITRAKRELEGEK